MEYKSFASYINEILAKQEEIEIAKKQLTELKYIMDDVAREHIEELTSEHLSLIKYGLGIPISYIKCVDVHKISTTMQTECECCGKKYDVKIKSKQEYDTFIRHKTPNFCEECYLAYKKRHRINLMQVSEEQQERMHHLKTMPYKEYLQTEYWKEFRKKVYRRYKGQCQLCGSTYHTQVHHNNYDCRGEETYTDVILLCEECHKKHHDIKGA